MDSRLLWGTVEMLILESVSESQSYGYEITQTVFSRSDGYFQLKEGSLYPALHRMEREKLLESVWGESPEGRRRKYYRLTASGRKALIAKRAEWEKFSAGVSGVMGGLGDPA